MAMAEVFLIALILLVVKETLGCKGVHLVPSFYCFPFASIAVLLAKQGRWNFMPLLPALCGAKFTSINDLSNYLFN